MELKDALKSLREGKNEETEQLTYFVKSDKDIHGGLNFEENIREIWINNSTWVIKEYIEQTIQPDVGATFSKKSDITEKTLDDAELLQFLSSGKLHLQELNKLTKKIQEDLKLPNI